MKMNKLPALMLVLALALSMCIFACAEDAAAVPEIPAELIPEIPAAHVEESGVPATEPEQAPALPAAAPAVETSQEFVPALSSHYAYISGGVRLYKTAAKDRLLGSFTGTNTVRVIWQKDYYNEAGDVKYALYQAVFYAGGRRVEGYFYASALGFITLKDEAELLDGSSELKILPAGFAFAGEEAAPAAERPCINTSAVNLRRGPSRSEGKVDKLAEGTRVDVIEAVTGEAGEVWLKVTADGKTGYVLADLVDGYSAPKADGPEAEPAGEPAPEEEPAVGPAGEPAPEEEAEAPAEGQPEEEPAGEPVPAPAERSVHVSCSSGTLQIGSTVTLTAELTGFENAAYATVWQFCPVDEDGEPNGDWQDGETGTLSHTYTLTEGNMELAWRMRVTVNQ